MSVDEWIGSIITMLAFAFMFFFNKKSEKGHEKDQSQAQRNVKDIKPPLILETLDKSLHRPKNKKQGSFVSKPSRKIIIDDLDPERSTLPSSKVTRLGSVPSIHGEAEASRPKVRKVIKDVKGLRNLVICREIMERKKF